MGVKMKIPEKMNTLLTLHTTAEFLSNLTTHVIDKKTLTQRVQTLINIQNMKF